MLCKQCGCEKRVTGSKTVIQGDKDPDTPTRLYTVLQLECRNKKCSAYGEKSELWREQKIDNEPIPQEVLDGIEIPVEKGD